MELQSRLDPAELAESRRLCRALVEGGLAALPPGWLDGADGQSADAATEPGELQLDLFN